MGYLRPFRFENRIFEFYWILISFLRFVAGILSGGEKCVRCGQKTAFLPLCKNCLKIFIEESPSCRCKTCGKPLVSEIEFCSVCRTNPTIKSMDGIFLSKSYRLWKKNLLFEWKIQEKRSLSPIFAWLVHLELKKIESQLQEKLFVVPVPPRPGKIRSKGWDQIEELCFFLSKGWNVPILSLLKRYSRTQQKKLDRVQRLGTIAGAYGDAGEKIISRIKKRFGGELPDSVVLIDDVLTTGATLEACSRILKNLGIKKVYGITLFVVD